MAILKESFDVPYESTMLEDGRLTDVWRWFFRRLWERVYSIGSEQVFDIVNNQSSAADITGMIFNKTGVSQAFVDFLVQRVTTGGGAVELIETGILVCSYNPTADDWNINVLNIDTPDDSGVTFSITSAGQVQYTSTNEGGTASISKLFWRARTLAGKNSSYSVIGAR